MKLSQPLPYPLNEFYEISGDPPPHICFVDGEKVPQPQRRLLVHPHDMTPTLESYFRQKIHLHLLQLIRKNDYILREVILTCEDGTRAAFGAIRINLTHFNAAAREEILGCHIPLGTILRRHCVPHVSRPRTFFNIHADRMINLSLELEGREKLFGRVNSLQDDNGNTLVEVVEILPPLLAPQTVNEPQETENDASSRVLHQTKRGNNAIT